MVSIFACFLIVRFVLPPWISLYFFGICINVIISCKNNDSVSWERKKRILLEGQLSKKRKSTAFYLPISNLNNFAKNDFHQKLERLMILRYQKSQTDPFIRFWDIQLYMTEPPYSGELKNCIGRIDALNEVIPILIRGTVPSEREQWRQFRLFWAIFKRK